MMSQLTTSTIPGSGDPYISSNANPSLASPTAGATITPQNWKSLADDYIARMIKSGYHMTDQTRQMVYNIFKARSVGSVHHYTPGNMGTPGIINDTVTSPSAWDAFVKSITNNPIVTSTENGVSTLGKGVSGLLGHLDIVAIVIIGGLGLYLFKGK